MINLFTPINQLGYGLTGLNIAKSLFKISDTALWVIGQPQVTNSKDFNVINQMLQKAILFDVNAPCVKIWHQYDMSQFIGRGKRIGFPIFELDKFNGTEKHNLSSLDKIFVTSQWAKDIILNNIDISNDNVSVIPLGVDIDTFKLLGETNNKNTVFFNCGKWEIRKGHDIIPEVFSQAFNEDDNVELWMMNHNPFLSEEEDNNWKKLYKNTKLGSKIKFIDRVASQEDVYKIMSQTDCGLFPSRAEGWNLELLEMLSCGKHVITTNYSAHKEFCNEENSFLVEIDDQEIAFDGQWFHGKIGSWAKIGQSQKDQIIEYMRQIHKKKQNAELIPNYFGRKSAENFTWDNSAKMIVSNI